MTEPLNPCIWREASPTKGLWERIPGLVKYVQFPGLPWTFFWRRRDNGGKGWVLNEYSTGLKAGEGRLKRQVLAEVGEKMHRLRERLMIDIPRIAASRPERPGPAVTYLNGQKP